MSERLEAAISGSFKFKGEIDALIDEFVGYNVTILEPSKGWLYVPSGRHLGEDFRPLPEERGLDIGQIERMFLEAVRKCDFLYVFNAYGYLGLSAAAEMGFAVGLGKPVYLKEPFTLQNFEYSLEHYTFFKERTRIMEPHEAVADMQARTELKNQ